MNARTKTEEQRSPLLPIEPRPRLREPHEVFMRPLPFEPRGELMTCMDMPWGFVLHAIGLARAF